MRKFGLIAAILGFGLLGLALLLRGYLTLGPWAWLPGVVLLSGGATLFVFSRWATHDSVVAAPKAQPPAGLDTARLLDNFEQRFAELKGRKASARVLGDLYSLGTQLEQRGRGVQATAVYRHLARIDATYRDVNLRLGRLMDAERVKPKSAPPAGPSPSVPTPQRSSAESATQSSPMSAPAAAKAAADKVAPSKAPAAPVPAPGARDIAAAADAGSAGAVVDVGDVQRLGRYQLEREIGRGAMGVVYLGRDTAINRLVAIKAIPLASEFSESELADARSRFFREAETAGRLNHPNIVTIYDVGEERGLAYIAMEYLKGRHLSDYASSDALLEPRKVLELIGRTAQALGFAHKQQVVHRDIKPANIMLNQRGIVKVMDFGIAKVIGERGLTRTGVQLGTVYYMSPEQVKGQAADARSDIYALGVTLYELLTAHVPFQAASEFDVLTDHVHKAPPLPSTFNAKIPKGIEGVVLKALEKRPEDRFQSVEEFAAALDNPEAWESYVPRAAALEAQGSVATQEISSLPTGHAIRAPQPPAPGTTLPPPAPARNATTMRAGIAAFLGILVLGIGGLVYFNRVSTARGLSSPPATRPIAKAPSETPAEAPPAAEPAAASEPKPATEHLTIPAKTEIRIHIPSALEASAANENQLIPAIVDEAVSVGGKTVLNKGSEASIVLSKVAGSKKSPKVQFQLSNLRIGGKIYKVRSDAFEFNGSGHGKRAGKLEGIGNAFGALGGGKHNDVSMELPSGTEMRFVLKAVVPITLP